MKKSFLTLLLSFMAILTGFAQILPVKLTNNSEFQDNEVFIGIIGQNSSGAIYYDLRNNNANWVNLPRLTTGCNTLHKENGDQGYADIFTRLSDIRDKTIYLDKTFACRMFIGFKRPMYMHVNDNNGGYAGANLQNPSDPNQGQRFEFVEFTYNDAGLWINTTRVDAFEYPMGLEVWGKASANVKYTKVGELLKYKDIISRWKNENGGNVFSNCLIENIKSDNLGGIIMQPSKVENVRNRGYFDDYINRVWNAFSSKELYADMGELGKWRGRVSGNVFRLTCQDGQYQGQTATINKPSTVDVIEGAGTFAQYNGSDRDLPVQAMFCGAMNRGVINTNLGSGQLQNWGDENNFFKIDTYNPYVKFFHQRDISYDSKTYAFAYDDTFGQSSTCYTNQPDRIAITIGGFAGMGSSDPAPSSTKAAPKPDKDAANVKSVYSNAYSSQVPNMFIGSWGQSTATSEVSLDGDNAFYNRNFNYLGIQFGDDNTMINASDMQYLHLDVYPESSFTLNVYPISKHADGSTNDAVSKAVSLQANQWNQIDIPLSDFGGLDLSKIFQMKFDGGNGQNFYLDNIYFYKNPPQPQPRDDGDYKLVWSDEFDSNTLRKNWNIEVNGDGGGNNELQYYTDRDKNVKIENGNLVITAYRENYNGKNFTSARVNSQGKVTFTHGKIEASIKLPNLANGLWPAFWMLGDDIYTKGWPYCGEIDILEMGEAGGIRTGKQNSWLGGTIHWGENVNDHHYYSDLGQHDVGYNVAADGKYHKYTCEWDDEWIKMYLDDSPTPYMTAAISKNIDRNITSDAYLHKPNFIIFNMAVGGGFPQIYDANGISALPNYGSNASMYVDYVRVYQKDDNIKYVENDANGQQAGDGYTTVLEAEDAMLAGGAVVNNDNKSSNGASVGNVGGTNNSGSIAFRYFADKAGTYTVKVHYMTFFDRDMYLSVNGGEKQYSTYTSTGAWDGSGIGTKTFTIDLPAGDDTITFGNERDWAPNVDNIEIISQESHPARFYTTIEAENATLNGGAVVNGDAKTSNGASVGNVGGNNNGSITFHYNAPRADNYTVYVYYMTFFDRDMYAQVNGGEKQYTTYTSTGAWNGDGIKFQTLNLYLQAGDNTITFGNDRDWAPNVDKFTIGSAAKPAVYNNASKPASIVVNGIESYTVSNKNVSRDASAVYNLNGQRVAEKFSNALPKGIYIVNGKKIIKK